MFDFHLHLARFARPEEAATALLQEGCGFNSIACEPWEWESSLELMNKLKGKGRAMDKSQAVGVQWFFGIHPMVANSVSAKDWSRLEEILRSCPQVQVGECGLDKRFEGYEEGGQQDQVLQRQLELAAELGREVQIHCVGDYHRVLREILKCDCATIPQVVFHRFGGDVSMVKSALKMLGERAVFSLHADSFRKKSTVAAIREIPANQVRFETDADDETWNAELVTENIKNIDKSFASIATA